MIRSESEDFMTEDVHKSRAKLATRLAYGSLRFYDEPAREWLKRRLISVNGKNWTHLLGKS
jgi:hypothetical protein